VVVVASPSNGHSRLGFGLFEADPSSGELYRRGRRIPLQEQPFRILAMLLERPGEVVTREEVRRQLWPDGTFVDFDDGLDTAVKKLRYALGDSAQNPTFIETIPRRGYRFIAPVSNCNLPTPSPIAEAPTSSVPSNSSAGKESNRKYLSVLLTVAAALLVVTALGMSRWKSRGHALRTDKMEITRLTDSGNATYVSISPDGRYVVHALRVGDKQGLWLRQVATRSDVQILPPEATGFDGLTFSPDGNYIYFVRELDDDPGIKYLYAMPALGGQPRLLLKDIDSPVSFSPNAAQFVFTRGIETRNEIEVRIANADGSGDRLLATLHDAFAGFQAGATWSPDGQTIAVAASRLNPVRYVLDTISVESGKARELFSSPAEIGRPLWLSEGDGVLLVLSDRNEHRELWNISYPQGVARILRSDLVDFDWQIDATRDLKTVATVTTSVVSNVWVAPAADLTAARPITSGELSMRSVAGMPDGKILARSRDGKIWILNPDGTQLKIFFDASNVETPITCGRFVLFTSETANSTDLLRLDLDGTNPTSLATGDVGWSQACSPDGQYVYWHQLGPPQRILRMPIGGGASTQVANVLEDGMIGNLAISPDGKLLAYPFEQYLPVPKMKLAVVSTDGAAPPKVLNAPGSVFGELSLSWSADGKALQYLQTRNGATNLWQQPVAGGKPVQLTRFPSGEIFRFSWSRDRQRLLFTRGSTTSDVVLLSNLR
jgi:DNA-binding winged helix-turn-helix (wHTH) protein/Tol biopolymer transport system component